MGKTNKNNSKKISKNKSVRRRRIKRGGAWYWPFGKKEEPVENTGNENPPPTTTDKPTFYESLFGKKTDPNTSTNTTNPTTDPTTDPTTNPTPNQPKGGKRGKRSCKRKH